VLYYTTTQRLVEVAPDRLKSLARLGAIVKFFMSAADRDRAFLAPPLDPQWKRPAAGSQRNQG
jgi:hypothetical protein